MVAIVALVVCVAAAKRERCTDGQALPSASLKIAGAVDTPLTLTAADLNTIGGAGHEQ